MEIISKVLLRAKLIISFLTTIGQNSFLVEFPSILAPSQVCIRLVAAGEVVRLTLEHDGFPPNSKVYLACGEGWPIILSGLKTLLETGAPLPDFIVES